LSFGVLDTAATRRQYLALSKAGLSCLIMRLSWVSRLLSEIDNIIYAVKHSVVSILCVTFTWKQLASFSRFFGCHQQSLLCSFLSKVFFYLYVWQTLELLSMQCNV